jgi:hypothetical protein
VGNGQTAKSQDYAQLKFFFSQDMATIE